VAGTRWLNDEEHAAWRGLQRMQLQLSAKLNRQLTEEAGLSLPDYGVLVALSEHRDGRMRAFELGRELGWEKSRLSHHISRMAERGLVKREKCASDQRGAFVAITGKGRKAITEAAAGHVAAVRRWFVDLLTPAQLRALAAVGDTVVDALVRECQAEEVEDGGGLGAEHEAGAVARTEAGTERRRIVRAPNQRKLRS